MRDMGPHGVTRGQWYFLRVLWEQAGLRSVISSVSGRDVARAVFILVARRFADPYHSRGVNTWLERTFVPDESGGGLEFTDLREKPGGSGKPSDNLWDSTLRRLAAKRHAIERRLLDSIKQTCGQCDEGVFYELSSSFVEAVSSRQRIGGWPARRQQRRLRLYLGAITCGDRPVAVGFFGGIEPGAPQIKRFLQESQRRFGFRKLLVVAPSGTEEEKLQQLQSSGYHYLVGVRRRRDPRAVEVIRGAEGKWVKVTDDTRVHEVLLPAETDVSLLGGAAEDIPTERYFIVHGMEDEKEEKVLREAVVERAVRALKELQCSVEAGRLRKPATIMSHAERILSERKGYRYISCRMTRQGKFVFWQDRQKSALQRRYEGVSLLKTSDPELPASTAVILHDRLSRLDSAFARIHDTLSSRRELLPLPDLEEEATEGEFGNLFAGHLLVSQLAFLLERRLEECLVDKKIALPLEDALDALRTISVAELRIGREQHLIASAGSRTANRILRAVGVGDFQPGMRASPASKRASRK